MAEVGYLYARDGVTTAVRDALLQQPGGVLTAVIQHSENRIQFVAWPPPVYLSTGQAFGLDLEVRWQEQGAGAWEMSVIADTPRLDLRQAGWTETLLERGSAHSLLLWGDHWLSREGADITLKLPDGWVEAQIQADLHYPVDGSRQQPVVEVIVCTYSQQGLARLTRFMAVTAVAKQQEVL